MKNDGGPAFPSHGTMGEVAQEGMSLRDWFAGKALQGMLRHSEAFNDQTKAAEWAYNQADAMLKEREK